MKILKVEKYTDFFVETDNPDFGGDYRRGENGGWEQRMGESWETCHSQEDELEAAFQEFMRPNSKSERGEPRFLMKTKLLPSLRSTALLGVERGVHLLRHNSESRLATRET